MRELFRRGRWWYIPVDCIDCQIEGLLRKDRYRNTNGVWRCAKCAAKESHRVNRQISLASSKSSRTHGESVNCRQKGNWLYGRWQKMKYRCKASPTYIAKNIQVCDEWKSNYIAFREWALDNGASETLELDRRDNNGNYCPSNCRWITHAENCRNRGRRSDAACS
jgi:hypothetical protein